MGVGKKGHSFHQNVTSITQNFCSHLKINWRSFKIQVLPESWRVRGSIVISWALNLFADVRISLANIVLTYWAELKMTLSTNLLRVE